MWFLGKGRKPRRSVKISVRSWFRHVVFSLKEDIKVSINSFKSFAVRETMNLFASKKYPGRPLKEAENEARCRIWKKERSGGLRRKKYK